MIVHNLNLVSVSFAPNEADPPLIIDADTVLFASVSTQGFETIARWDMQVFQGFGGIKDFQLYPRPMLNRWGEATRKLALKDPFRFTIGEALDHIFDNNAIRYYRQVLTYRWIESPRPSYCYISSSGVLPPHIGN